MYSAKSSWLAVEFCTFHEYAIRQLPQEKQSRFWDRSKNYLDFFRFRSLLRHPQHGLRAHLSRELQNPEISWFVIRSYIKGFNLGAEEDDRWMTPEDFATHEELSRRERQVSQDVYEEVWAKVWPWYKALTIPGEKNNFAPPYWDNIDLAWEVLNHRALSAPSYAILICDEVQDLTRVELASIFQSSEFLKYHREPSDAGRVPIILAGDSYQTINPACFRWARVKADCARALVQQIPQAPRPRIEAVQLVYNYRNRPSIARLCNALQLLRQEIVDTEGKLQKIWQPEGQPLNQAIRRLIVEGDGVILKDLFEKGVSFLGPEPGDTEDPMAASFWRALGLPDGPPRGNSGSESKALNYESPVDVKGLEKPFIALLGFGAAFAEMNLKGFWEWDEYRRESIGESQLLAAEYFLNRLYVAASRAREQLWIVETEQGWRAFWQPLEDWIQKQKNDPRHRRDSSDSSEQSTTCFDFLWSWGSPDELVSIFRKEWPGMAREYESQADAMQNGELAERAAYYYQLAGDAVGGARAIALMYHLRGQLAEAVRTILPLDPAKALTWAWEASAWDILARRDFADCWQHEVACLMLPTTPRDGGWIRAVAELVDRNQVGISKDLARISKSWLTWSAVITDLVERAAESQVGDKVLKQVQRLGRQWRDAPHSEMSRFHRALGQLEYRLRFYDVAVELWEKAQHTQHQDYFVAKAKVTPYPENLQYLESAQQWQELLHQEQIHPGSSLNVQDQRRVLRACRELQRWRQAVEAALPLDNQDFVELWRNILADASVTEDNMHEYLKLAHDRWLASNSPSQSGRSWSLLMLDCLLALQRPAHVGKASAQQSVPWASACTHPTRRDTSRRFEPIYYALTLECEPQRVANHFQRVWESRQDRPERWKEHSALLRMVSHGARRYAQQLWNKGRAEEAAVMTHLVCRLVWKTRGRKEDTELRSWFDELAPWDYISWPGDAGDSRHSAATNALDASILADVRREYWDLPYNAIRMIAEAPRNTFRELQGHRWREFQDLLDGLGYALLQKAREQFAAASEKQLLRNAKMFLLLGRLCQQARFRKLAVEYYGLLERAMGKISFPQSYCAAVQQGLSQALDELAKFREQKSALAQEITIRPGERAASPALDVECSINPLEVILTLRPGNYQARVLVDQQSWRVEVDAIRGIQVSGPTRQPPEWELSSPKGNRYRLIWQKKDKSLRIEAPDKTFIVEL
ncbi:MAG: hypothetical protein NZM29_04990 [Nitrospira sp.]|nr:hypothetical protein [Nitrospira sp.]